MANHKRDYYEVLGVGRSCAPDELKAAYRKAALKWHPDRNPDNKHEAEERFKEASEAYAVLSDLQNRAAYDRYGHAGVGTAAPGWTPDFSSSVFEEFSDIFGDLFGFGDFFGMGRERRRSRAERGADLRYDLKIKFEEAARGLKTKVKIPRLENCQTCHGSGLKPGTRPATCSTCHGRGQVRYQQGFFTISRTCHTCQGSGNVIPDPCSNCRGEGRVEKERTLEIRIPPGVDTGNRLRFSGEGEAGPRGGPPGDLYVVLHVEEHPFFDRKDADLYCTIPVSFSQAALGTEIKVPTLDGEERLKIPEGTQTGSIFRLKGRGMAQLNGGGRGDLFVHVRVVTPAKLTREQKRLLEQLAQTMPAENRPAERESSLFEKVKDIFG